MIFLPELLTKLVCECAGGNLREYFYLLETRKEWTSDHVTADTMVEYGSPNITFHLTNIDLDYAKQHLDRELMSMHGYHHPENRRFGAKRFPSGGLTKAL